jgi:hypothetical protein
LIECGVSKRNIDVWGDGQHSRYNDNLWVSCYSIPHNVQNCAWKIFINGKTVFYATDTSSLRHLEMPDCDLYFVEANYTESEITERIRAKQESGEFCHEWDVLNNHLSKEKAEDWLYANMGQHSQYVLLHQHED